jgi:hypothetical protein
MCIPKLVIKQFQRKLVLYSLAWYTSAELENGNVRNYNMFYFKWPVEYDPHVWPWNGGSHSVLF